MDASSSATTILVRHLRCQSHSFRVEEQISNFESNFHLAAQRVSPTYARVQFSAWPPDI